MSPVKRFANVLLDSSCKQWKLLLHVLFTKQKFFSVWTDNWRLNNFWRGLTCTWILIINSSNQKELNLKICVVIVLSYIDDSTFNHKQIMRYWSLRLFEIFIGLRINQVLHTPLIKNYYFELIYFFWAIWIVILWCTVNFTSPSEFVFHCWIFFVSFHWWKN